MVKLKSFEITTLTDFTEYIYFTKAKNGKEALTKLVNDSNDFTASLDSKESNHMTITVNKIK